VTKQRVFTVNYSNIGVDEKDSLKSSHLKRNEALAVAFGDDSIITEKETWVGTPALIQRLGITPEMAIANGEIHAAIALFEDFSKGWLKLDGIYWNEQFENKGASASFCSIFPSKEQNWTFSAVEMPPLDSELMTRKLKTYSHRHNMPYAIQEQRSAPASLSL
jgi:hypothetical protein